MPQNKPRASPPVRVVRQLRCPPETSAAAIVWPQRAWIGTPSKLMEKLSATAGLAGVSGSDIGCLEAAGVEVVKRQIGGAAREDLRDEPPGRRRQPDPGTLVAAGVHQAR